MGKLKIQSILFVILIAPMTHAATRCASDVIQAVKIQAEQDFPNDNIKVVLPDYHNENDDSVVTYTAKVYGDGYFTRLRGEYLVTINETCQIMSGPTYQAVPPNGTPW